PGYTGSQGMLMGHGLATAEGPVLVRGDADDVARSKVGRIWQGGKVIREHPLSLVMNRDSQRTALTGLVADRVNNLFLPGLPAADAARPASMMSPSLGSLRGPQFSRQNIPRYMRVVRLIPLADGEPAADGKGKKPYRQRLAEDLLDPARTVEVALRLEALGVR